MKLGVIGLGRGFALTLPSLTAHEGVQLAAAADPRPEARTAFEAEFGGRSYDTAEGLAADPEIDAVYVASPSGLHAAHAILLARAGKHVLVDKPLAVSLADSQAMVDAAEAAGVLLVCGPSHGSDLPVTRAAEIIASGRLGAPKLINALNFTDFVYRPRRAEELRADGEGGVIFNQGAHQVEIVRRLAQAPVRSVRATLGDWDTNRSTIGAYSALIQFENGASASMTYSGYAHYDMDEHMNWVSELGYEKDSAKYGDARRALAGVTDEASAKTARTYGAAPTRQDSPPHHEHFGFVLACCEHGDLRLTPDGVWEYGDGERRFVALDPPLGGRYAAIDEFVRAVRGEAASRFDGRWALETVKTCAAIALSGREQREVKLAEL